MKSSKSRPSIFLSHTCADKDFVWRLASDLKKAGAKVWVDDAEIMIGDSLIQKIQAAISEMDYLGVVLSPEAVSSGWVKKELEIALTQEIENHRVKVLPIKYKDCELPPFLAAKLYADFTKQEFYLSSLTKILQRLGLQKNGYRRKRNATIGEDSKTHTNFIEYKLINPESVCGYEVLAVDPNSEFLLSLSEDHISIDKLYWESRQWLNTDYALTDETISFALDKLIATVKRNFFETDFSLTVYSDSSMEKGHIVFAFQESEKYYEVEYNWNDELKIFEKVTINWYQKNVYAQEAAEESERIFKEIYTLFIPIFQRVGRNRKIASRQKMNVE